MFSLMRFETFNLETYKSATHSVRIKIFLRCIEINLMPKFKSQMTSVDIHFIQVQKHVD